MAKKVFISYRRADTEAVAGRLRDRLLQRLPKTHVFFDTGSIEGGDLFKDRIEQAVETFDTMIVMIGKAWLGPVDGASSRILNAEDYVRLEVRAALARVRPMIVLPVLIDGAGVPAKDQLPEDIRGLLMRNMMRLGNVSFDRDFESLFARTQGKALANAGTSAWPLSKALVGSAMVGCAAVVVVGIAHWLVFRRSLSDSLGGNGAAEMAVMAIAGLGAFAGFRYWQRQKS